MRRWLPPLLALLLALVPGPAPAATPGDGTDHALQAEMERLFELRSRDPQAFVSQTRTLEGLPPPTSREQREFLQFLSANRATFEGRFADAIAAAKPLAERAEDPALRLRAAGFIVNMQAATREFEAALRQLAILLKAHPTLTPGLENEVRTLWNSAAILYSEFDQHQLAARYARDVLAAQPTPRQACVANLYRAIAGVEGDAVEVTDGDFAVWREGCRAAGETSVAFGFLSLAEGRHLRKTGRGDDALTLMGKRLVEFESTRYPRLMAEAYALDAELLFEAARYADAERQAREAVALSKDLPTGRPVAMAEKVLSELATRRGDDAAALQHMQRHVAATRALADEARIKELAFRTVQHEMLQQDREFALSQERNRVLELEARMAKAESRNLFLTVGALGLCMLGLGAWGWRMRREERRMRELAEVDGLTGFANRQHFATSAENALRRAEGESRGLMLVTFDLDHFKRINDEYGHLAGDAVLSTVSDAVRKVPIEAGQSRLLGRIGGEEFAILIDSTPEGAIAHAEACRLAISGARAVLASGHAVAVTASFGIAGTHEVGYALQSLLAASDRSLYRAKAKGRDQVCAVDPGAEAEVDVGDAPAAERVAA